MGRPWTVGRKCKQDNGGRACSLNRHIVAYETFHIVAQFYFCARAFDVKCGKELKCQFRRETPDGHKSQFYCFYSQVAYRPIERFSYSQAHL